LNVNMGALNLGKKSNLSVAEEEDELYAAQLLAQIASVYSSISSSKKMRVCKRVMFSGALPIARDTESYTAMMSVLDGGSAGQLEYAAGQSAFNPTETQGLYNYQDEFLDSRAEAKRASEQRMAHLRLVDEKRDRDREGNQSFANDSSMAPNKQSAFQIAVSVAHAAENKDSKSYGNGSKQNDNPDFDENNKFRLLGNLPTLNGNKNKEKQREHQNVSSSLSLLLQPQSNTSASQYSFMKTTGADAKSLSSGPSHSSTSPGGGKGNESTDIPKEFLCAINGHVMKNPVKVQSSGLVFEEATIDLWLTTRGSVCPITNTYLDRSDLAADDELRNRIKRYHIQQTALRRNNHDDDDLYDF